MNDLMKEVKVIDAIMGSGKTTDEIERMKKSKRSFLYVTPFLEEVERILENVPDTYEPKSTHYKNYKGEIESTYKKDSLLRYANSKTNLVTTHSLFSRLHKKDYSFFNEYDLILDEVITPIKVIDMKSDDIDIAFRDGLIVVNDDNGEVSYTGENYNGKLYAELKMFCETSNVTYVNDRLLVWTFPPEIFISFNSVTVLTYLFEGSLLASYFKYYKIPYKVNKVSTNEEFKIKQEVAKNLTIYEGIANKYGDLNTAFSVNWLKKRKPNELKSIKTATANLVWKKFKTTSDKTAFTTFKAFKGKLKGKGYSRGFITVNERATNKYGDKETMIYLANMFLNPKYVDFFRSGGVEVNQDDWAKGELLQWIWRGSIRNNKKMNLYIPSKRMRNLLLNWLYDFNIEKLNKAA